jgi:hypothetical protein
VLSAQLKLVDSSLPRFFCPSLCSIPVWESSSCANTFWRYICCRDNGFAENVIPITDIVIVMLSGLHKPTRSILELVRYRVLYYNERICRIESCPSCVVFNNKVSYSFGI